MRFETFETLFRPLQVIDSSLLYPFYTNAGQAQRQLSDWTRTGKLQQLRRGVYVFNPPFSGEPPHRFQIANLLVRPSYVSLQTALAYYDLIPEHVAAITSVTTVRPQNLSNGFGRFNFRHIQTRFFSGFRHWRVSNRQYAFLASPEKALLDLIYLTPGGEDEAYLRGLRLQNLDRLDVDYLKRLVDESAMPKLERALRHLLVLVEEDLTSYMVL